MTFEIFKGNDDQWRFHAKARNGEIVAASEGYKTERKCRKAIDLIRRDAAGAKTVKLAPVEQPLSEWPLSIPQRRAE